MMFAQVSGHIRRLRAGWRRAAASSGQTVGMSALPRFVLVGLGALAGVSLRWEVESVTSDDGRSLALIGLNLIGSILVGWLAGSGFASPSPVWALAATGFSGGLTTFSSFALDVALRINGDATAEAFGLVVATVFLAVVGSGLGYRWGRTP
jgi:CrcB protein